MFKYILNTILKNYKLYFISLFYLLNQSATGADCNNVITSRFPAWAALSNLMSGMWRTYGAQLWHEIEMSVRHGVG